MPMPGAKYGGVALVTCSDDQTCRVFWEEGDGGAEQEEESERRPHVGLNRNSTSPTVDVHAANVPATSLAESLPPPPPPTPVSRTKDGRAVSTLQSDATLRPMCIRIGRSGPPQLEAESPFASSVVMAVAAAVASVITAVAFSAAIISDNEVLYLNWWLWSRFKKNSF